MKKIKVSRFPNNCGVKILSGFPRNTEYTPGRWRGYHYIGSSTVVNSAADVMKEVKRVTDLGSVKYAKLTIANLVKGGQSKAIKALKKVGFSEMGRHSGAQGTIVWLSKKGASRY